MKLSAVLTMHHINQHYGVVSLTNSLISKEISMEKSFIFDLIMNHREHFHNKHFMNLSIISEPPNSITILMCPV